MSEQKDPDRRRAEALVAFMRAVTPASTAQRLLSYSFRCACGNVGAGMATPDRLPTRCINCNRAIVCDVT